MKIQLGGSYRNRKGERIDIKTEDQNDHTWSLADQNDEWYRINGTWGFGDDHENDLIEPWTEGFDVVSPQPFEFWRCTSSAATVMEPLVDKGDNMRLDAVKEPFDRLPAEFLFALAKHYAAGARKYPQDGGRGWEKGMAWGRCFASMMRHAWKWWTGEDIDEETGSHHLIAVIWNAVALYTYHVRKIGEDDRAISK